MKEGLNKQDIILYHKMLKQDVPLKEIAQVLHTTVEVLKRLTPAKIAEADKEAATAEATAEAEMIERQNKIAGAVAGAMKS